MESVDGINLLLSNNHSILSS